MCTSFREGQVTNTEKIRIQKETIRKSDLGTLFSPKKEDEARAEIANLRLHAIASLPHLGVFSDEAHQPHRPLSKHGTIRISTWPLMGPRLFPLLACSQAAGPPVTTHSW